MGTHAMRSADTALELRMLADERRLPPAAEIDALLAASSLVRRLTREPGDTPLFWTWRLIALSEIPGASRLPYTQALIDRVYDRLGTPAGFSLTGEPADIVPCYNAMLVSALCRLGHAADTPVVRAVEWIRRYQSFDRERKTAWTGVGIQRYGGCLNATPCYIGLAKSVSALLEHRLARPDDTERAGDRALIDAGVDYMLRHRLYKRLSNGEPISPHILDIAFPESYNLTLLEILRAVHAAERMDDARVGDAVTYLRGIRASDGWHVTYAYRAPGYVSFDARGRASRWVTHFLDRILPSG